MPLYDYRCDSCNIVFEAYNKMDKCRNAECPKCKAEAHQVFITPPMAYKEILPHFDRGLGRYVNDRSERKRIMAEKGLVEADSSVDRFVKETREEDADRNRSKRR